MEKQAEFTSICHVSEMEELSVKNRLVPDCSGKLFLFLKVVGNEKEGGSRQWQMIGIGLRPRRWRFVSIIILLLSLILCISVSAPVKQNE
jgi:hypothetical protein